jgi:hypothetical protein
VTPRLILTPAISLVLALVTANARAAGEDGAYGRLAADLGLELGAGPALGEGGPSLLVEAAAVYLATAGGYARYIDTLGSQGAIASRSIAAGVWMRPLFLARFASNYEHGPARLDLLLDSLGLGLGVFWTAPQTSGFERDPGLELSLGLDLPVLASATGPFLGLRGALRLRPRDLTGPRDLLASGAFVALTFAWHHLVGPSVVDAGDTRAR